MSRTSQNRVGMNDHISQYDLKEYQYCSCCKKAFGNQLYFRICSDCKEQFCVINCFFLRPKEAYNNMSGWIIDRAEICKVCAEKKNYGPILNNDKMEECCLERCQHLIEEMDKLTFEEDLSKVEFVPYREGYMEEVD